MLGHKYTCEQIINSLRAVKFLKVEHTGFLPAYARTELTDDLHSAFNFRTDYEILPREKREVVR